MNPMMHQSVTIPKPVPVPVNLPIPGSGTGQSSVGKRRREDELLSSALADESAAKRRAKLAQDVLFRIVVPSRQIGKVIGKEGCRIQKVREDTKAAIKIADAIAVSFSFIYMFSIFEHVQVRDHREVKEKKLGKGLKLFLVI